MRKDRRRKWSDEDLKRVVPEVYSYHGIFKALGIKVGGGTHQTIKNRVAELGLDTSHFTGKAWCQGDKHEEFIRKNVRLPLTEILKADSGYQNTHQLKMRLIKEGLKDHCCEICGLEEWMGAPIPIQLHHINGVRNDHRFENLQILCPNCHAQTENYCSRNSIRE